jgi:para-nitrobenzyl esterase
MQAYFVNFIKTGDPNGLDSDGSNLPEWKPYNNSKAPMNFTDKCEMGSAQDQSKLMRFLIDFHTK